MSYLSDIGGLLRTAVSASASKIYTEAVPSLGQEEASKTPLLAALSSFPFSPFSPNSLDKALERARRFVNLLRPEEETSSGDHVQTALPLFIGAALLLHAAATAGGYYLYRYRQEHPPITGLNAEAVSALEQWKDDHQTHLDYANFFIKLGANSIADEKDLSEAWKARDEKVLCDDSSQVKQRRDGLYWAFYYRYGKFKVSMTDFLRGKPGNCIAQTELVIADFNEKIKLPAHQILLAQVFQNHVQPVIYDLHSKEVWSLVSGRKTKKIKGDLYYPAMLFEAKLKKRGIPSPVSEEDLLFMKARPEDKDHGEVVATPISTEYEFPKTDAIFKEDPFLKDGQSSDFGFLPSPVDSDEDSTNPSDSIESEFDEPKPSIFYTLTESEIDQVAKLKYDHPKKDSWLQLQLFGFATVGQAPYRQLVFQNPAFLEAYLKRTDYQKRHEFLLQLAEIQFNQVQEWPFAKYSSFLDKPEETALEVSEEALRHIRGNMFELNGAIRSAGSDSVFQVPANETTDQDNPVELATEALRKNLLASNPKLQKIHEQEILWAKRIWENPNNHLALLNSFPEEDDQKVVSLIWFARFAENNIAKYEPNGIYDYLSALASDPDRIEVADSKEKQTPFVPHVSHETLINVELMDSAPNPKLPSSELEGIRIQPGQAEKLDKILISRETMMMLIMHGTYIKLNVPLARRWTPEMTEKIRIQNKKNRWVADDFLQLCRSYTNLPQAPVEEVIQVLPPDMAKLLKEMKNLK